MLLLFFLYAAKIKHSANMASSNWTIFRQV